MGGWCFLLCLLPRSCDRKQERVVKVGQCTEQQIAADRQILDTIASYFLLDLTALYSVPGESIRTMVCLVFSTPIDLAVICLLHSQALDNKKAHTHTINPSLQSNLTLSFWPYYISELIQLIP